MSVIGVFTPAKDGGWTGYIRTMIFNTRLRLVPNDNCDSDNAPAFRVLAGNSRVGDAWEAHTAGDNPKAYWRLRLDDPALPAPFTAALFSADDGASAQLVWSRRRNARRGDDG